jgi:HD-GYP domain-containing protein (c-di-GMP phosphodiesterase class II)
MSARGTSWDRRRVGAWLLRAAVSAGPFAVGCGVAIGVTHVRPAAHSVTSVVAEVLVVTALSTLAVIGAERAFRRLAPLGFLLRLSLVFPDRAPSRFKLALRAGSSRRLTELASRTRTHGLDADPSRAAEQVLMLVSALGAHDRRTRGHSERVRLYARLIGEEMGLRRDELQKLEWGALLHDLGKLRVPPEILNKKGTPDPDEWAVLQEHPAHGERIVGPLVPFLGEWADAVGGHHERWDGTGYPRKRGGHDITRSAAIVSVADAFETMTAVRSYKRPMSLVDARNELARCAGSHFSPDVVRAFLSVSIGHVRLAMGPVASLAQLPFFGETLRIPAALSGAASGVATAAPAVVAAGVLATGLAVAPLPDAVAARAEGGSHATATESDPGSDGSRSSGRGDGPSGADADGGTSFDDPGGSSDDDGPGDAGAADDSSDGSGGDTTDRTGGTRSTTTTTDARGATSPTTAPSGSGGTSGTTSPPSGTTSPPPTTAPAASSSLEYSATGPTATRTSSGTLSVSYPASTQANDLLLLIEVNAANQAITTPSGWSLLADQATSSPSQYRFTVWWRSAGNESSVALGVHTNSNGANAWVTRYRRADGSSTPASLATSTVRQGLASPSLSLTPSPDIATSGDDATVISVVAVRQPSVLSLSSSHGFDARLATTQISLGQPVALGIADRVESSAGTVASPTWTQVGVTGQWAWATVAFR